MNDRYSYSWCIGSYRNKYLQRSESPVLSLTESLTATLQARTAASAAQLSAFGLQLVVVPNVGCGSMVEYKSIVGYKLNVEYRPNEGHRLFVGYMREGQSAAHLGPL